jgi:hypothetical protein
MLCMLHDPGSYMLLMCRWRLNVTTCDEPTVVVPSFDSTALIGLSCVTTGALVLVSLVSCFGQKKASSGRAARSLERSQLCEARQRASACILCRYWMRQGFPSCHGTLEPGRAAFAVHLTDASIRPPGVVVATQVLRKRCCDTVRLCDLLSSVGEFFAL